MTISDISTAMVSEKQHDWRDSESTNLQTVAASKMSGSLDAKSKMRLSVQMARIRAKLPPEEKARIEVTTPRRSTGNENNTAAREDQPKKIAVEVPSLPPPPPPPPCNACMPIANREYISNLLRTDGDSEEEPPVQSKEKERRGLKRISGWTSASNLLCKKPTTDAESRSSNTAKSLQRRSSNHPAADIKVKINLYDRYTASAATETFKFYHYSDLRLYIKQYRRNHSCGLGNRSHAASASPAYDGNLQRYDYGFERVRSYLKGNDGFMLGLHSAHAPSQVWKASTPVHPSIHQKTAKDRRHTHKVVEEPVLSPRVFVRQNLGYSHLWKTKDDGTQDPCIAITRPPTTQASPRSLPKNETLKENPWSATPSPTKSSPGLDSPGDLNRETPTWLIMQMIASCSRHPSRTDGSSSTTTNDFKSKTSDIGSSRGPEKSPDIGGTSSSSASPDDSPVTEDVPHSDRIADLKRKYGLLSNVHTSGGDRTVMYNNTRSILSNMSNLLTYYIESEEQGTKSSTAKLDQQEAKRKDAVNEVENDIRNTENRKQLVLLRKELKTLASRRSPSRQNFPSSADLAKVGSLVVPAHKQTAVAQSKRCNTSPQTKSRLKTMDRRPKMSPSPTKTGYSGYKKVLSMAEQTESNDKPMLFVKRSQLLPTVMSSVEAMKSKQVMLHNRTLQPISNRHPADSKQFTKITDLLKNQRITRPLPNTASGGRRVIHTGLSRGYSDPVRSTYSSHSRRK